MIVISHTAFHPIMLGWHSPLTLALELFHQTGIMQHYLITRDGDLLQFVDTELRAWHAGKACWHPIGPVGTIDGCAGVNDVNSHSVGVSLEGNGCEEEFTTEQYATLNALLSLLRDRYSIRGGNVVGFGEVAHPPGRHVAPGLHFDWDKLELFGRDFPSRHRVQQCREGILPSITHGFVPSARSLAQQLLDLGYSIGDGDNDLHVYTRMQIVMDRYLGQSGRGLGHDAVLGKELLCQLQAFHRQQETNGDLVDDLANATKALEV
jgi:N-acetyl-anhydromuramyl-L-alanine amidase AmpD